jgi:AraC-like DNA-binding protein
MISESIFILFTSLLGLITVSIMLFSINSNRIINLYLVLIILITCSRLILLGTFNLGFQGYSKDFIGPLKSLIIFIIPFWFLYFKSLVKDNKIFSKIDLVHLISPLLFSIYIFTVYYLGYENNVTFRLFNFVFLILFSIFYCIKSFKILNKHIWNISKKDQTKHLKLMRNWTIFIYGLTLLLVIRLLLSFTIEFFSNKNLTGETFVLIQSIAWLITFIKIIISPEILYGVPKLQKRSNSDYNKSIAIHPFWNIYQDSTSNLKDNKLKIKIDSKVLNLIKEIEFLSVHCKFFRNQKMKIDDVANEMNIPLSHLVYLFKYHCQLTFTEYKTYIKIDDAKQLIESGFLGTNTLESLAIEVGFSSYNPFFIAFKKLTALSPNEYALGIPIKVSQ